LRFNKQRDREVNAKLHEKGWIVIRVWEHTVRQLSNILSPENLPKELLYLLNSLNQ
jgi:G:T-mismatch repair DNA endonuclease (very short patch repair protein)